MLDNRHYPNAHPSKTIDLSQLIAVFQKICELSIITRSDQSSCYDFDRSTHYISEYGLDTHIAFPSWKLNPPPLNSEKHLYSMNNIAVRNLHINLDDRSGWTAHDDWQPLSSAKWHFEFCRFEVSSSTNMWDIQFPWLGSFRFYNNEFHFRSDTYPGHWLFVFRAGSTALFQGNNFQHNTIQTRCVPTNNTSQDTTSQLPGTGTISFVGNKAILDLGILEGYSSISFSGMNHIDSLWFHDNLDVNHHVENSCEHEPTVYFGTREKLDRHFNHCLQHRNMFLYLRRLAAMAHDTPQLNILDKHIDRIDYHLNKELIPPPPTDFWIWCEYWQDRLLYAWRRWSSNFYKSWLQPLLMMLLGYMLLNMAPWLLIDDFSFSHWTEFTLRPVREIAEYEQSLSKIIGHDYGDVSPPNKIVLKLIGFTQVIWLAMCSFAFVRSIKR